MGGTHRSFIRGALANAPVFVLALSLAATISCTNGAFAAWQDHAARGDLERLGQLPQIRAAALQEARARGGRGAPGGATTCSASRRCGSPT